MIPFILVITLHNRNLLFVYHFYCHRPIQCQMDLGFFEDEINIFYEDR
jgi:hypothetical protein